VRDRSPPTRRGWQLAARQQAVQHVGVNGHQLLDGQEVGPWAFGHASERVAGGNLFPVCSPSLAWSRLRMQEKPSKTASLK